MPTGQERIRSPTNFASWICSATTIGGHPAFGIHVGDQYFRSNAAGLLGLAQPQSLFIAATFLSVCPAPYTAATCPNHGASSPADVVNGPTSTFLGQNLRSNTFQLQYDFTHASDWAHRLLYTARTVADFSSTFFAAETYFPGGAGGTALASSPPVETARHPLRAPRP